MTPSAPIPPMICEKSIMSSSPVVHHRERLQRQPQGSTTTAGCRRADLLPKEDSYSMRNRKKKGSGGFSRQQDPAFINAFGDKIAAIAEKAEKRVRTGMGLREQEQHMVKLGRENWALKIDVTLLKKKRDELGSMNEQLTQQVEALSRENRELKRELKRTQVALDSRERELDEACRIYEKLGQTKAVLEVLTNTQQTQQPGGYDRHWTGNPVWGSQPASPSASVRSTRRLAPKSLERERGRGLPVLSSPSVSTCCSLRHIPRHISTDDEGGDSSEDDSPTPPTRAGDWESEKDSCISDEVLILKPRSSVSQVSAGATPPSSTTSSVRTRKEAYHKRVLKFNRCEEPDSSDYSSGEEDMFDSDCYGSTTSLHNTLTPMTSSPEPNRAYIAVAGRESNPGHTQKPLPPAAPTRAGFAPLMELTPIDETPDISNNTYRNSMFCNGLGLIEPFDCSASVADSMLYSKTNATSYPCRIPIPSTTKSTVQRKRRHLDSTSKMMTAREALTKKLLKV